VHNQRCLIEGKNAELLIHPLPLVVFACVSLSSATLAEEGPGDTAIPAHLVDAEAFSDSILAYGLAEEPIAWVAHGATLSVGEVEAHFADGFFFPIVSGRSSAQWAERDATEDEGFVAPPRADPAIVGAVFIGEGELVLNFSRADYARQFATHMVLDAKTEAADVAGVARGEPWSTDFTDAWFTQAGPAWPELLATLPLTGLGDEEATWQARTVVVSEDVAALKAAHAAAKRLLDARLEDLKPLGLRPRRVRTDRVAIEHLGAPASQALAVADFLTDTSLGYVNAGRGKQDRYLTVLADDSGAYDAQNRSQVLSVGDRLGDLHGATVAVTRFESWSDEPDGPQLPAHRFDPIHLDQSLDVDFHKQRFYLAVDGEQRFRIRAVGGPHHTVAVRIARQEALKDTWRLTSFELADGTPLSWEEPGTKGFDDASGTMTGYLPAPVRDGEELEIVVRFEGTWPYANVMKGETAASQGSLGESTGLQMIAPELSVHFGGGFSATTEVSLPMDADLEVAISGLREPDRTEGDRRISKATTAGTVLYPGVAVGKWRSFDADGVDATEEQPTKPAITVHMFKEN